MGANTKVRVWAPAKGSRRPSRRRGAPWRWPPGRRTAPYTGTSWRCPPPASRGRGGEAGHIRAVVRLHVVDDEVGGLLPCQRLGDVRHPLVGGTRVHGVEDGGLLVPDDVGVVADAGGDRYWLSNRSMVVSSTPTPRMALLMFFTLISTFPLCYWCVWSAMAGNYFKNHLSIAQSAVFVNYLSGRMAE